MQTGPSGIRAPRHRSGAAVICAAPVGSGCCAGSRERGIMSDIAPDETRLAAEIERLKADFPKTRALCREACALLFFRFGITPTANRLYQFPAFARGGYRAAANGQRGRRSRTGAGARGFHRATRPLARRRKPGRGALTHVGEAGASGDRSRTHGRGAIAEGTRRDGGARRKARCATSRRRRRVAGATGRLAASMRGASGAARRSERGQRRVRERTRHAAA